MRLTGVAATAWLAALGIAAAIVGGHDTFAVADIGVRLPGSLLLLAGIFALTGAAGLVRRRPVGLALAMLAALLGMAIGLLTLLTQVVNRELDARLAIWTLVLAASGATARQVFAVTPEEERAKGPWGRLPILKSAISIGVLVSIAQFWWTEIYLPTTAPPSLTLETKLHEPTSREKRLDVQGSVTIRNTSDTRVYALASSLNVIGTRLRPEHIDDDRWASRVTEADRTGIMSDRHVSQDYARVVSHGRLVQEHTFLDPGEVLTVPVHTWVPKATYNTAQLLARITIGRGKALELDHFDERRRSREGGLVYLTQLPEAGWLRRLTRGDRYQRVEYDDDPQVTPTVAFVPDRRGDYAEDFDTRQTRIHGVGEVSSEALVSLPWHEGAPAAAGLRRSSG